MKTEQEIQSEIERLNKIDGKWNAHPENSNLEDAIRYLARREALIWVLEKGAEK